MKWNRRVSQIPDESLGDAIVFPKMIMPVLKVSKLRHDGPTAPWLIDTPMNRAIFETYVETQLAPTIIPGDVVILDKLSSHIYVRSSARRSRAEQARFGRRRA